jgi:hypothetical protein
VKRERNRRKLRNFIVNKKQLILVVSSTIYFFLTVIVTLTVMIAPVYSDIFKSSDAIAQREAAKVFILLSEKLGIALSAIFLLTIIPLIWGTHRFFGPLINFLNIFKRVAGGDLTARVCLRRGDLLKSEARLANEMIQSFARTISDVKQQNHLLVTTLNGIVEGRCPESEADDYIFEACEQARTCERLLATFVTAELPGQGDTPEDPPLITCPRSYQSTDLKDPDPGAME